MSSKQCFPKRFLPDHDPLITLPKAFGAWEYVAQNLPKLLVTDQFRGSIHKLPQFPVDTLQTPQEIDRAMQLLSYLGHAYVWGSRVTPKILPEVLARPWYEVATLLERPPILSYASYALCNWRRLDPKRPIELGNIVLIQNFLGGIDEEWFILIHVEIEARAKNAIEGCQEVIEAVIQQDISKAAASLEKVEYAIDQMCKTLERMPEHCDPYIYYNRVRPYIHGWKNHPKFENGLVYEGVYNNEPQKFLGETGAQSSIMPMLDALLCIEHKKDEMYKYLQQMRIYMPKEHRVFIEHVEAHAILRDFVKKEMGKAPELRQLYNSCIEKVDHFRDVHLGYAANYIQKQHETSAKNPHNVGTGGTPFMQYLKKHKEETRSFLL